MRLFGRPSMYHIIVIASMRRGYLQTGRHRRVWLALAMAHVGNHHEPAHARQRTIISSIAGFRLGPEIGQQMSLTKVKPLTHLSIVGSPLPMVADFDYTLAGDSIERAMIDGNLYHSRRNAIF